MLPHRPRKKKAARFVGNGPNVFDRYSKSADRSPIQIRLLFLLATIAFALASTPLFAADDYQLGRDSHPQDGSPKGRVVGPLKWRSEIFPETERDHWVYVPAQYDPAKPAALMVVQAGGGMVRSNGQYRVPTVLDNWIHRKEIPVIVGLFINPGKLQL